MGVTVSSWWARGRHRIITLAALATTFGLLSGLALGHWRSSPGPFMRRMSMDGAWIKAPGTPGYVGHFRRRFILPGPVKHAWIAVTAREGFEVCVNRNPAGRFYLWRPTRPFQTGLSEGGQVINPSPAVLALNFPREYQWASHRNDWLVFLDEPTSGLDSFLAESVVSTLKGLARNGRTLVCTIHQPSSEVYAMFDQVCYLARGQVAYFGNRPHALDYFSSSLALQCPTHSNPSDFIIKQLSIIPADPEKSKANIAHIVNTWASSKERAMLESDIDDVARESAKQPAWDEDQLHDTRGGSRYATGFITQTRGILWRSVLAIMRDKMLTKARAGQTLIMGLVIGLIYLRLGNSQSDVQNRVGAVFLMIMNQSMGSLFGILNMFAEELPIYQREHRAGLYSSYAYYIARSIAEIPTQIVWPFLFVTIAYWMIGLNDDGGRYIEFTLSLVLTANAAMSLGYALAIGAPSVQVALAMGMPIILPFILFGGLFINVNDIPKYLYSHSAHTPHTRCAPCGRHCAPFHNDTR